MKYAFTLVLLATAITFLATPATASAGNHGCCGGGFGFGGYYSWASQHIHTDRQIPYFAQHPPVYYSYPVPRTYGYSPYAYSSYVKTPDGPVPSSMISNPYEPQRVPTVPCVGCEASASRPGPKVVLNPYVLQGATVADANAGR